MRLFRKVALEITAVRQSVSKVDNQGVAALERRHKIARVVFPPGRERSKKPWKVEVVYTTVRIVALEAWNRRVCVRSVVSIVSNSRSDTSFEKRERSDCAALQVREFRVRS